MNTGGQEVEARITSVEVPDRRYYGSIALKRFIGPNLLKGLAISVCVHLVLIALPALLEWLHRAPEVPKQQMRVIDLSQLIRIAPPEEPAKPSRGSGTEGGSTPKLAAPLAAAPAMLPPGILATPYELDIAGSSLHEPHEGTPPPPIGGLVTDPNARRFEPVPAELPEAATVASEETGIPSNFYPSTLPRRGELSPTPGTSELNVSTSPAFASPNVGPAASDMPPGLGFGDPLSSLPGSGTGSGDMAGSPYGDGGGHGGTGTGTGSGSGSGHGRGPGSGSGEGAGNGYDPGRGSGGGSGTGLGGNGTSGDILEEQSLSGLLAWLRKNRDSFPAVVRSYLDTAPGDLCGVASNAGWDIFIQFSEETHQLKLFLSRGETGILLADSDFKRRSQLFGMGRVTRDAGITAIEATREKPSTERTAEFYNVFNGWMDAKGIAMGTRAAK